MKIKHKLLSDFQYISPDKKIFIIKAGTVLEAYNYKLKSDIIPIDREIVDANPEIFSIIDWKAELLTYIKTNKLPTPAVLTKKLIPFIEEIVLSNTAQNIQSVQTVETIQTISVIDETKVRELELKELELNSRERLIKDQEEDIANRIKRVQTREDENKRDVKSIEDREEDFRKKSKDIETKIRDIHKRELKIEDGEFNLKKFNSEFSIRENNLNEREEILNSKYSEFLEKSKSFISHNGNSPLCTSCAESSSVSASILSDLIKILEDIDNV
jgi:hypothetical protein